MTKLFAGLDVGDRKTAICVLNTDHQIILEVTAETAPSSILRELKPYRRMLSLVGHEAGPKANWLHKELARKKLKTVCLDPWRTHAALAANRNKTDKIDAQGIAELLSRGMFATSYIRSDDAEHAKILLLHRSTLIRRSGDLHRLVLTTLKMWDAKLEKSAVGEVVKSARGHRLDPMVQTSVEATLRAIATLRKEADALDLVVKRHTSKDPVCRRLMTVPGIGPITALAFRAAIDDPTRFSKSRSVGAYFGLTPRTYQSGGYSASARISRRGDPTVRALLYQAGACLLNISRSQCALREWGLKQVKRKGFKFSAVACARRMAVTMHRMWITGRDFCPAPSDDDEKKAATRPRKRNMKTATA